MAVRVNIFFGVIFFNRANHGWSVKYALDATDFPSASAALLQIVVAHSYVMGAGVSIVWALVRQATAPPPAMAILATPIESLKNPDTTEYWLPPHDDFSGPQLSFETDAGQWANKILHGVADDEITAGEWLRKDVFVPAGPVAPPPIPNLATKDDLFAYFLATIRDHTLHAHQLPTGSPIHTHWEISSFSRVLYVDVNSRDIGRDWKYVSWEALWPDSAPAFSPCGERVGVVRSTYEAPCLFYYDGLPMGIRWYDADPAADIFPLPTIFWPYSGLLEYSNPGLVGESTGKTRRSYTLGNSLGAAPGTHYSGTPADFLGLSPSPWTPPLPTPLPFQPECDMPLTLTVRATDGSVVIPNTFFLQFPPSEFNIVLSGANTATVSLVNPNPIDRRDPHAWRKVGFLGRWYPAGLATVVTAWITALDLGKVIVLPFFPGSGGTVDAIGCTVQYGGAAGSEIRLAIYRQLSDDNPTVGDLLFESAAIPIPGPGAYTAACDLVLHPDKIYFLAIMDNGLTPRPLFRGSACMECYPFFGFPLPDQISGPGFCQVTSWPFAPFPGAGEAAWVDASAASAVLATIAVPGLLLKFASNVNVDSEPDLQPGINFTLEISSVIDTYVPGIVGLTLELSSIIATSTPPTTVVAPSVELTLELYSVIATSTPPTTSLSPSIDLTLELSATTATAVELLFRDLFTDAGATDLDAHAPNVGIDWLCAIGDFIITSNSLASQLTGTMVSAFASYAAPPADCLVYGVLDTGNFVAAGNFTAMVLRAVDIDNCWRVYLPNDSNGHQYDVVLSKFAAGVETVVDSAALPVGADQLQYPIMVRLAGNQIDVYVSGVLTLSATDATYQTEIIFGVAILDGDGAQAAIIDDFQIAGL